VLVDELERLAVLVEQTLRRERERLKAEPKPRRPRGRPATGDQAPHGTERRYQWEARQRKLHPATAPPTCAECRTAHALERRRRSKRRALDELATRRAS
jgi:hypothetical protein